ncbi:MAG: Gfo/Idh/MocA family oxidoreductase [Erysipelotrichaceae bacterium]|nr:Gfo/Idh/MocA family oxidoreductase [Erysipelotrichaceae bacterium]
MRFGIVGTNFVSDMFMKAASYVEEVKVVGVCSGRKENAIKFALKYDIENIYDDYISMLESGEIEAIYIATPNVNHKKMTLEALKRKVPVFCEKPFAVNDKEVKEMVESSKKNNTYLHNGIVPLYTQNLQIIKDNLEKVGKIRKVTFSFCKYSSRYDAYLKGENPTTFRNELANGSIMDLGIYVLSDAIALFGKPKSLNASAILLETQVDACGTIILSYDEFEVVLLHSKVSDTEIVSEISGEKGMIHFEIPSLINKVYLTLKEDNVKTQISIDNEYPYMFQLKDFVKNVKEGNIESNKVPHSLSILIHEILTEARKQSGVIYKEDNI